MEFGMLEMNIGASEWGIIILALVLLIAGSNRFSDVARLFGRATGEYEKARDLFQKEKDNAMSAGASVSRPSSIVPHILGPVGSEREKLKTIAKALGIKEGEMTDDQLRFLISQKIKKNGNE
jgi:sec-independent protein translocase protein TatA